MFVQFRNPRSGEIKKVKIGFSFVLFFFSGFWGIPLFLRKLNELGLVMLVISLVYTGMNLVSEINPSIPYINFSLFAFFLLCLGLGIWLGIKGNELTAKNYLDKGWEFVDPESDFVKLAKSKWGLT